VVPGYDETTKNRRLIKRFSQRSIGVAVGPLVGIGLGRKKRYVSNWQRRGRARRAVERKASKRKRQKRAKRGSGKGGKKKRQQAGIE
jgi:hypothetical protein